MKFIKKIARIVVVAGILLVVFAIYIYFIAEKDKTGNPANTFVGSDFSVSKTPAVFTATPTLSPTPTPKPLAKDALRYIINNGTTQKSFDRTAGKDQTVFLVLENLSKSDNIELAYSIKPSIGVFIDSIDNIKNATGNNYWLYYLNGELSYTAADKQTIKAGDVIEWKFEKKPFLGIS